MLGVGLTALDGLVHVRHGGQRHRLQHRLDLRHLPELHHARTHRDRALPVGGPHHDGRGRRAHRRHRLLSRRTSTTSWICCSWCSLSSTRRCSPRSCSACSGSAPPGTAPSSACWPAHSRRRFTTDSPSPQGALTWHQGRLARRLCTHYPERDGAEFLDRDLRVDGLLLATILISLVTRQQKSDVQLTGLVSSLTPRTTEADVVWYKRPATLACWSFSWR